MPLRGAALFLLGVTLALFLWRAGREQSLWCDEIFTLVLVNHTPADLIDFTALDNHPPAYYLALKTWIKLGRAIGFEPGVFWARLPGLAGWLAIVVMAWAVGRRLIGGAGGPMLATGMALAGQLASSQHWMRGYAVCTPALAICFLLLMAAATTLDRPDRAPQTPRGWALLWSAYALAAGAALWSHLLSSMLLLVLGFLWIGLTLTLFKRIGRAAWRHPLVLGGAVAQAAAVIAFAPWIRELHNQASNLQGPRRTWMTPRNPAEFLRVFILWFPWGVEGTRMYGGGIFRLLPILGALSAILPIGAALTADRRTGDAETDRRAGVAVRIGWIGVGAAISYVLLLLTIDLSGLQYIFHGPRYTLLAGALWGAGLAGLAVGAAARRRRGPWLAAALLAPWIVCGLAGHALQERSESRSGMKSYIETEHPMFPPPGATLYVIPPEMIPYHRRTLAAYDVRRIEDLAASTAEGDTVHVLRASLWNNVDRERDTILLAAMNNRRFSDDLRVLDPTMRGNPWEYFLCYDLIGFHPQAARGLGDVAFRARTPPPLPGTLQSAHPRDWRLRDGWNNLEIGAELEAWRWSAKPVAKIRFPRPLEPGRYTIALLGLRGAHPNPIETLWVGFEGEEQRVERELPEGWFDLRLDVTLTKRHEQPILRIGHPTYQLPEELSGNSDLDPRALGVFVHQAAAIRAEAGSEASH
jgi:hypothetical protein